MMTSLKRKFREIDYEEVLTWVIRVLIVIFAAWAALRIVAAIRYDIAVSAHVNNAVHAVDFEVAENEMAIAIENFEAFGLTEGCTGVLYKSPADDVGLYYQKLLDAREEYRTFSSESELEKFSLQQRMEESLKTAAPSNISVAVHGLEAICFWWGLISFLLILILWVIKEWFVY